MQHQHEETQETKDWSLGPTNPGGVDHVGFIHIFPVCPHSVSSCVCVCECVNDASWRLQTQNTRGEPSLDGHRTESNRPLQPKSHFSFSWTLRVIFLQKKKCGLSHRASLSGKGRNDDSNPISFSGSVCRVRTASGAWNWPSSWLKLCWSEQRANSRDPQRPSARSLTVMYNEDWLTFLSININKNYVYFIKKTCCCAK